MGLFPIMMNVIQFWLIDSIVKGSDSHSPLSLDADSSRGSDNLDMEPLFRTSEDDSDDDDGLSARHDIENPRPISRSRSRDVNRLSGEPKSVSSGTTTVIPSGSSTPLPKPIDTAAAHAYPPSQHTISPGTSPSSSVSSSSASSSHSHSLSKGRRRSPPPPLSLRPPKATLYPNVEISRTAPLEEPEMPCDEEKWDAWGEDDNEDWAERVGEDEWTGRRIAAKKDAVDDTWRGHDPHLRDVAPIS